MSRALRRHPVTGQPGGRQRPGKPPSLKSAAAAGKRQQREARERAGFSALLRPRWATDIISELRKVTWPTREETWNLTWVVVLVAGAFGVLLGGVDMFFNWAIENTLLR